MAYKLTENLWPQKRVEENLPFSIKTLSTYDDEIMKNLKVKLWLTVYIFHIEQTQS